MTAPASKTVEAAATGDGGSRPLREGLFTTDPPRLLASECADCGSVRFPPKQACPDCRGSSVRPRPLSTSGTVRTFTVVRNAPSIFALPYVLAYVELPEGVQVFSQVTDVSGDDVEIGMPVELVIGPIRHDPEENLDIVAYTFRPGGGS